MKVFRWSVAALPLMVMAGCTHFTYDGQTFEHEVNRVIVFNVTQAPTPSMWSEVGSAEISRIKLFSSEQGLILSLRLEAGEIGADAIHITSITVEKDGQVLDPDTAPWNADWVIRAKLLHHIPINDQRAQDNQGRPAFAAATDAPAPATAEALAAPETPAETPVPETPAVPPEAAPEPAAAAPAAQPERVEKVASTVGD